MGTALTYPQAILLSLWVACYTGSAAWGTKVRLLSGLLYMQEKAQLAAELQQANHHVLTLQLCGQARQDMMQQLCAEAECTAKVTICAVTVQNHCTVISPVQCASVEQHMYCLSQFQPAHCTQRSISTMPGDVQLLLYLDLSNKKPFQYSPYQQAVAVQTCLVGIIAYCFRLMLIFTWRSCLCKCLCKLNWTDTILGRTSAI